MDLTKDTLGQLILAGATQKEITTLFNITEPELVDFIWTFAKTIRFEDLREYFEKQQFHIDKYVLVTEEAWNHIKDSYLKQMGYTGNVTTHMGTTFTTNPYMSGRTIEVYGAYAMRGYGTLVFAAELSLLGTRDPFWLQWDIPLSMESSILDVAMIPTKTVLALNKVMED